MKSYHMMARTCGSQKKTQAHRYREQIGGCQRQGTGGGPNGLRWSKGTNFQLQAVWCSVMTWKHGMGEGREALKAGDI